MPKLADLWKLGAVGKVERDTPTAHIVRRLEILERTLRILHLRLEDTAYLPGEDGGQTLYGGVATTDDLDLYNNVNESTWVRLRDTLSFGVASAERAAISAAGVLSGSGLGNTYTPTFTGVANVTTVAANGLWRWARLSNTVVFGGAVDVDPAAGATGTTVAISLGVASNIAANTDVSGTAQMDTGAALVSGVLVGDAANDRALLFFYSDAGAANKTWWVHGIYEVK